MLTADGKRQRTAGGVFFYLLREYMEPAAYRRLMADDKRRKMKLREQRRLTAEKNRGKRPRSPSPQPSKRPCNALSKLDTPLTTSR